MERCTDGNSFCRYCNTDEKRQKMCEENKLNNPKHQCKMCGINTNEETKTEEK